MTAKEVNDVVTIISLVSHDNKKMLYNLTFLLRSLFFFFLKILFEIWGCILYMGAHYTRVNMVALEPLIQKKKLAMLFARLFLVEVVIGHSRQVFL